MKIIQWLSLPCFALLAFQGSLSLASETYLAHSEVTPAHVQIRTDGTATRRSSAVAQALGASSSSASSLQHQLVRAGGSEGAIQATTEAWVQDAVRIYGNKTYLNGAFIPTILLHHRGVAFPLILGQLHPVHGEVLKPSLKSAEGRYEDADAIHVIRMVQMLQYLTGGISFIARTSERAKKLGPARRQALQEWPQIMPHWDEVLDRYPQSKKNVVGFYGTDSPSGVYYLAPIDAQRRIIRMWKDWYNRCGATYTPPPETSEIYSYDPEGTVQHFDRQRCRKHAEGARCCGSLRD